MSTTREEPVAAPGSSEADFRADPTLMTNLEGDKRVLARALAIARRGREDRDDDDEQS